MAPFILFMIGGLTLGQSNNNNGFSEDDMASWVDEIDKQNESINSFLKDDDIESRLVDEDDDKKDGVQLKNIGSYGLEAIHCITENKKSKPKAYIDNDKVKAKIEALTDEEKKKILEDKKAKMLSNEKTKVGSFNTITGFLSCVLLALSSIFFGALYVSHYIGHYLVFILLPSVIYDLTPAPTVTKSSSKKEKKDRKKKHTENKAVSIDRVTENKFLKFVIVLLLKVFCWAIILQLLTATYEVYLKIIPPYSSDYAFFTIVAILIIGFLPVSDKAVEMIKKSYNIFQEFGKANKERYGNISVEDLTDEDITDKDIVKYFKNDVISYTTDGDVVDACIDCEDNSNDDRNNGYDNDSMDDIIDSL